MSRAAPLAAALALGLASASPAIADGLTTMGSPTTARGVAPAVSPYDPAILWKAPTIRPIGSRGRVRLVPHEGGAVILSLDQYWSWRRSYDEALSRLAFRMPVERAQPEAIRLATAATLAEARARGARLTGLRGVVVDLDLVTPGPDYRVNPPFVWASRP